jgi:hypothetical protein
MFVREFAADLGELPLINFPLVVDGERAQTMQPPPALGAHTDDILAALGYQPGEISRPACAGFGGVNRIDVVADVGSASASRHRHGSLMTYPYR